jgi:hypothetical protein
LAERTGRSFKPSWASYLAVSGISVSPAEKMTSALRILAAITRTLAVVLGSLITASLTLIFVVSLFGSMLFPCPCS